MHITIVYALPDQQWVEDMDVPDSSTIQTAFEMSSVPAKFPEVDLASHKVGIYGKLAKTDQQLEDGDRIEIYRSLPAKPRNAHAAEDKKERIRAKKERLQADADETE